MRGSRYRILRFDGLRSGSSGSVVLKKHDAALAVQAVTDEGQTPPSARGRKKRSATTEQDGNDGGFHRVDAAELEEIPEELASAEQPDVLPGSRPKVIQSHPTKA